MQEVGNFIFQRAVVPGDAVNLDINTIDAADTSSKMLCITIYIRFPRRNGTYSCQLVFSSQKLFRVDLVNQEQNYWLQH